MMTRSLRDVCHATTISKLMYASPAWVDFAQSSDSNRIEGFIRKCKRLRFLNINDPTAADLFDNADIQLLSQIVADKQHVGLLHSLLPPRKNSNHNLRIVSHPFVLPGKANKNFISMGC